MFIVSEERKSYRDEPKRVEYPETDYPSDSFLTIDEDADDRQFFVPLKKQKPALKAQPLLHFNNPLSHNRPHHRPSRVTRQNVFGLPGIPGLSRPARQPQFGGPIDGDFRVSFYLK